MNTLVRGETSTLLVSRNPAVKVSGINNFFNKLMEGLTPVDISLLLYIHGMNADGQGQGELHCSESSGTPKLFRLNKGL